MKLNLITGETKLTLEKSNIFPVTTLASSGQIALVEGSLAETSHVTLGKSPITLAFE
jgi:hypothetical protein